MIAIELKSTYKMTGNVYFWKDTYIYAKLNADG